MPINLKRFAEPRIGQRRVERQEPWVGLHQLFADFVCPAVVSDQLRANLVKFIRAAPVRMVEVAREVAEHPNRAEMSAKLMAFSPKLPRWSGPDARISIEDGEVIGRALYETGQFSTAQAWFERTLRENEKGDIHGRTDHERRGISLHEVGVCLSR